MKERYIITNINPMKTKTIIEELTQEDLVDLLCTATYGSSWLEIYAPDRMGIVVDDNDCREDVWAKALLAGRKIHCVDYYAEGDAYGTLEHETDDEENVIYHVSLQDIYEGLTKCADGTFKDANVNNWVADCFNHFKDGEGEMDNPQAEALMQVIMFGELIYG